MDREEKIDNIALLIVLIAFGFISARLLHNGLNAVFHAYNLPEFSIGTYRYLVFGLMCVPKINEKNN